MPLDLILTIIGSVLILFGLMGANIYMWHKRDRNKDNRR